MSEETGQTKTRLVVLIAVIVVVAGAVASGIWAGLSGPTGEPAWIRVVEETLGSWSSLLR